MVASLALPADEQCCALTMAGAPCKLSVPHVRILQGSRSALPLIDTAVRSPWLAVTGGAG